MTDKKHKATVRVEREQDQAAVDTSTEANRADEARSNQSPFQSGGDCQDALMRCYNR